MKRRFLSMFLTAWYLLIVAAGMLAMRDIVVPYRVHRDLDKQRLEINIQLDAAYASLDDRSVDWTAEAKRRANLLASVAALQAKQRNVAALQQAARPSFGWMWLSLAMPWPVLIFQYRRSKKYWRERRRREAGLCIACGYDLRASTERCPECGMSISAMAQPDSWQ